VHFIAIVAIKVYFVAIVVIREHLVAIVAIRVQFVAIVIRVHFVAKVNIIASSISSFSSLRNYSANLGQGLIPFNLPIPRQLLVSCVMRGLSQVGIA
jgi:hypothetical protein